MRVFGIKWHGLGDSLAFSNLPERFTKELGEDCYFYSNDVGRFKNSEIYELVWGMNPYIKGTIDETPNSGGCIGTSIVEDSKTVVWNFEIKHGLEPKNLLPKIYYKPRTLNYLKDVTIIDLNSFHYHKDMVKKKAEILSFVKDMVDGECLYVKYLEPIGVETINEMFDGWCESLTIYSLLYYCDVLNSCKRFIGANSGCNSLISAIKQNRGYPQTDIIMTDINEGYVFPNNNYHYV